MQLESTPTGVDDGGAALDRSPDPTLELAQAVLLACEQSEDEWEVGDLVDQWVDEGHVPGPKNPELASD